MSICRSVSRPLRCRAAPSHARAPARMRISAQSASGSANGWPQWQCVPPARRASRTLVASRARRASRALGASPPTAAPRLAAPRWARNPARWRRGALAAPAQRPARARATGSPQWLFRALPGRSLPVRSRVHPTAVGPHWQTTQSVRSLAVRSLAVRSLAVRSGSA